MTFDIHLHIEDKSPEGNALEAIVSREHLSPEEAILHLLKQYDQVDQGKQNLKVRRQAWQEEHSA
jgi:hypothetical protein